MIKAGNTNPGSKVESYSLYSHHSLIHPNRSYIIKTHDLEIRIEVSTKTNTLLSTKFIKPFQNTYDVR